MQTIGHFTGAAAGRGAPQNGFEHVRGRERREAGTQEDQESAGEAESGERNHFLYENKQDPLPSPP